MGRDPKNTHNRNSKAPTEKPQHSAQRPLRMALLEEQAPAIENLGLALVLFIGRFRSDGDRGYLRIIDTDVAEVWYVKWKWTAGRWAGHYVFDSCADGDLSACLRRLHAKVVAVRQEALRPTKDKRYD